MSLKTWLMLAAGSMLLVLGGLYVFAPRTVETPSGFEPIVVALPPGVAPMPKLDDTVMAAASHIMIAHNEADPPIPGITRTKAEAFELATQVAFYATERGADFAELAREYSDDPRAATTGGYMGIVSRMELPLELRVNLFGLEPGQVYPTSESVQGYHILKRHPFRRALAQHILISWDGSDNVKVKTGRTKSQALLVAQDVLQEVRREDVDFCDLTSRFSDDSQSRFECGVLGIVEPQTTGIEEFEYVLFRLRPGEISDLVESSYGYHIIRRLQ